MKENTPILRNHTIKCWEVEALPLDLISTGLCEKKEQ